MKIKFHKDSIRIFSLLVIVLLATWILFYTITSKLINDSNNLRIQQSAEELLSDLSENIEHMEQISYAVSSKEELVAFFEEKNIATRHALALDIYDILENDLLAVGNKFSIVAIDKNGWYYRFSGSISTIECQKLALLSGSASDKKHLFFTLNGANHIGYATQIFSQENEHLGTLFIIENEENLLEYFYNGQSNAVVSVAILNGENVLSSTSPYKDDGSLDLYTKKQVGITPFQVSAWLNPEYEDPLEYFFAISASVIFLIMMTALLLYARHETKKVFAPLVHVMNEADKIDFTLENELEPIGSPDFDNLITKINGLLTRLTKQNEAVKNSLLLAEKSKTRSEKAINYSLKKQINAHFIVNTLSTIQMMIKHREMKKSEKALSHLSEIVRYAFDESSKISIWGELRHIQIYVEIMNLRYNHKIDLNIEADDRLMDIQIPRMILQPIVENSIVHGFIHRQKDCQLNIDAELEENQVIITIKDNGVGMKPEILMELNEEIKDDKIFSTDGMDALNKMAIHNVKRRLFSDTKSASFSMKKAENSGIETHISYYIDGKEAEN